MVVEASVGRRFAQQACEQNYAENEGGNRCGHAEKVTPAVGSTSAQEQRCRAGERDHDEQPGDVERAGRAVRREALRRECGEWRERHGRPPSPVRAPSNWRTWAFLGTRVTAGCLS